MSLPIPNLDDRTFSDLVEELRALIPRYAPEWTDHNVSDPGIMLIELFSWLAEALIYRLNRVPDASEARFLELLGARFLPAAPARCRLRLAAPDAPAPVSLPAGTVVDVTVPGDREAIPFEIMHAVRVSAGAVGVGVAARQCVRVEGEKAGRSSGKPLQAFTLRHRFVVVQAFPRDLPEVLVDDLPWSYTESFIGSGPGDSHFTVDPRVNAVCFGDGARGRIPPEGARIVVNYRYTLGSGGSLPDGAGFRIRGEAGPLVRAALDQDAAPRPGKDPTDLDEARVKVAAELRRRWRAVTEDDFEALLVSDPVDSLKGKIARVKCLPEMGITQGGDIRPMPGSITVVVVPQAADRGEAMPYPDSDCIQEVERVLEERRLVTSRIHVTGPGYTRVKVRARVALVAHRLADDMVRAVERDLRSFFDPLSGGPHGTGWPFGRDVYPSEVYQVIEESPGVDHVESLELLAWDDETGWVRQEGAVEVRPNDLVELVLDTGDIVSWTGRGAPEVWGH